MRKLSRYSYFKVSVLSMINSNSQRQEEIEKLERKVFDLKQLIEISKGLNSTLEYNILIDSILLTCMGQMQLIKAGIFLRKDLEDENFILHRNYKGFELDHKIEYVIPAKADLIDVIVKKDICWTLEDLVKEVCVECRALQTLLAISPLLIVPLKSRGKLKGIIILGERINALEFTDEEKEYLMDISSLAGIAIENAYLYELATTDMMTRLKIHHFFQTLLIEEREFAISKKSPLSLLMIDIDHFKDFNDKYGHLCGDIVLKNVANVIKNNCRQFDIPARYGGEEMVIILPRTELSAAIIAAERIRRQIEHTIVEHNEKELSVNVSIGVAEFKHDKDKNNYDLIDRADRALYLSKINGRNRVSFIV